MPPSGGAGGGRPAAQRGCHFPSLKSSLALNRFTVPRLLASGPQVVAAHPTCPRSAYRYSSLAMNLRLSTFCRPPPNVHPVFHSWLVGATPTDVRTSP